MVIFHRVSSMTWILKNPQLFVWFRSNWVSGVSGMRNLMYIPVASSKSTKRLDQKRFVHSQVSISLNTTDWYLFIRQIFYSKTRCPWIWVKAVDLAVMDFYTPQHPSTWIFTLTAAHALPVTLECILPQPPMPSRNPGVYLPAIKREATKRSQDKKKSSLLKLLLLLLLLAFPFLEVRRSF